MLSKHDMAVCADDFGLSAGIDRAVLDLVERGRLSAVSCMVAGPSLPATAGALAALSDRTDIGLHLTFTDLAPLGPMPGLAGAAPPTIGGLIRRAHTGGLDRVEIAAEVGRQIARFREIFGRAPDFVDGHQHVHVLRPVRHAVFAAFDRGDLKPGETWIRNCVEPLASIRRRDIEVAKTAFIAFLSRGMAAAAGRRGVLTNDSFRGVTGFDGRPPFGEAVRRFMSGPGRRPLMMCHPAAPGEPAHPTDVIMPARHAEYAYLGGPDFEADLQAAGIRVRRLADLAPR